MYPNIRVLHMIGTLEIGGSQAFIMNIYRKIDRNKMQFDFIVDSPKYAYYVPEIKSMGGKIYYFPKFNGKNYIVDQIEADAFRNSKATKVTIEKNIKIIKAKAFNKSKIKILIVKSKNLKKAVSVKQCFKGCKSSKITVTILIL